MLDFHLTQKHVFDIAMLNILTWAQCSLKLSRQCLLWSGKTSNSNCIGRKLDIQMMNVTQMHMIFFYSASNASRVLFNASNISQDVDCIQSIKKVWVLMRTEGIGVFLNFLSFVHFKIHIIHLNDFISIF